MIKPLLVIHHADQRPVPGHLRQQAQHGQAHQEAVRRGTCTDTERGPQRITLRRRQGLQPVQHRRAQLMQPGERQFHLRLDTGGARYPAPRGLPGQVLQQRRLPHPRLTAQHQDPALTRPDSSINRPSALISPLRPLSCAACLPDGDRRPGRALRGARGGEGARHGRAVPERRPPVARTDVNDHTASQPTARAVSLRDQQPNPGGGGRKIISGTAVKPRVNPP